MGSFRGTCEIVEAKEELYSTQHSRGTHPSHLGLSMGDKDRKLPVLKLGRKDSLEDDINQLFEAINLKNSSKAHGLSSQVATSPLRKNTMKKPITVGMPQSPGFGNSESVSLKQALRDLCISKASEMAAMKRLSKSSASPGVSEAGRIKSLYNTVVVEASGSGLLLDEGKGSMFEISLVPEEGKSMSSRNMRQPHQFPEVKSANQSARSSPRYAVPVAQNRSGPTSIHNEIGSAARKNGNLGSKMELMQKEQHAVASSSSCTKSNTGSQTIKTVLALAEEPPAPSQSCSDTGDNVLKVDNDGSATTTSGKALASKLGRKGRLHSVPSSSSSIKGNKVNKITRSTPRLSRPVLRSKGFVKKKIKRDIVNDVPSLNTHNEVKSIFYSGTNQLVCQRCQCTLKNVIGETNEDSFESYSSSLSAEFSSSNLNSTVSKTDFIANNCNKSKAVNMKAKGIPKSREKGEFSQSSKSSIGDFSSSTSMSDESNLSGSSCGNRPHMSKDVRWGAIRDFKMRYGVLGLGHFNLLKKLGHGDIGTVYLAELISTNCLFAIKVMDNEFLARRKKMPRAQTEREILRMLDHPFLPTLYAQFTEDNLSCLVMEYCPGGDLHVLRQKQPGRCYSEPEARFYVAEVLLALEYLHMLGIIYRDLKPENILVREDGHIMLTDFDLSLRCTVNPTLLKSSSSNVDPVRVSGPCTESSCIQPLCIEPSCQVPCFSPRFLPAAAKARKLKADLAAHARSLPQLVAEPTDARSNSFVGTHEYLAPEIIKGEGHGAAVDWWTFGIFLYELLYGKTPFKGAGNEETLANVVLQSLRFPDSPLVSFQARELIRALLVKEPENRLGTEKGAAEIKQHPFFEGLSWALIRCAIPPELPDSYEFVVSNAASQEKTSKYLECKATGEHLEFELF